MPSIYDDETLMIRRENATAKDGFHLDKMVHSQGKLKRHSQEKKPPEIVVQDFGEDMFDLGTPKDVEHMYKFVLSPRQSPASVKWGNGLDVNWCEGGKLKIPYGSNSCVLFSPSPSSKNNREFENWDAIFQANGAEDLLDGPEKGLTDSFLMELGLKSPHSKVTLFSPKSPTNLFSENFLKEIGLENGEVTLLSPRTPNMISTKTPVVVKRQNEGKCKLAIYLPPSYTPALVDKIQSTINQEDLTMFPFPPISDDSVSDCSHNDDTDVDMPTASSFFSCIQEENLSKATSSSQIYDRDNHNNNIDMMNNNNNNEMNNFNTISLVNNNNLSVNGLNNCVPNGINSNMAQPHGTCSVIQRSSTFTNNIGYSQNHLVVDSVAQTGTGKSKSSKSRAKEQSFRVVKKPPGKHKEVRVLHNDVERKRRGEMHSRFQKLRENIPELENDKKAAKIMILKMAKKYIKNLEDDGRNMEQIKDYEKRRNRDLLDKLCRLTGTHGVCG